MAQAIDNALNEVNESLRRTNAGRLLDLGRRVRATLKKHQVSFLSAGLAFYAVIAIFPAVAVVVALFGLVADRADAERFVQDVLRTAPTEASDLVATQLGNLAETSAAGLGVTALVSVVALLWSASAGTRALIRSVNLVHGGEPRSAIELRAVALGYTLVATLVAAVAIGLLTVLPALAPDALRTVISWVRWPLLALLGLAAITVLYEHAPTEQPSSGWAVSSLGAVVALVAWILASAALTFYFGRIGSLNETYGTFGAVVLLLLWLYATAFAVLLGAAIDHAAGEVAEDHPARGLTTASAG